ncbi:MAG: hypothetical protein U9P70_00380 [Patescibacteria group bacterium]|nr:hypothetical protein [Patescibacteria group bacterium]
MNKELIKATRNYQKYLGQTSLNTHWEIANVQFEDCLLNFFNKKQCSQRKDWEFIFRENPDKRMQNFDIDVSFKNFNFSDNSINILQQIRKSGVKYKDQHKKEIASSRKVYKNKLKYDYIYLLNHHNISIEEAEEFIDSDGFANISNIDIFCQLWAKDLSHKERKGKNSDSNDIDMLSAYLPYCDIIATDNYMKGLIESLNLDSKYECRIFSLKDNSLNDFIFFLKEERKKRQPANRSLFSVVCIKPKNKDFFDAEFIDKINLARNKFLRTGKHFNKDVYVPILFLFDKEESFMPKIIKDDKGYGIKMNENSISEMKIFGYNFDKIYLDGKSIEQNINEIPDYLKGNATAIISEDDKFDHDLKKYDSYIFSDIEEAVNQNNKITNKYKIKVSY